MSLTTIWNVLNNTITNHEIKRGIEIPMIQRDYAQGRKNNKASEIRKVFLNKLLITIKDVIDNNSLPLELDFVYGYLETETFIPLDGQQRLTTLYLLHWYFAFKEQKLSEFKTQFSKFSYQTRQSSEDFLKRLNSSLSAEDYSGIFDKNKTFETVITDKNWYFVNWKYDLTIQSAITMLDEIHLTFNTSDITFADLISETKPPIVFNFLNIDTFGLSDDLYIKMNARGKPLTNFENLKAELGKFIELSDFNNKYDYKLKHSAGYKSVNVEAYFITKTDTSWSDFFWGIRNKETNEFDDKLLNLLAFVALNELIKGQLSTFDKCIGQLENNSDLSYYRFQSLGLLNENSIISYINILDLLVSENEIVKEYLSDKAYLDKGSIISSSYLKNFEARYPQRILFYASFKFLIQHKGKVSKEELKRWDRLIRNLVVNTIYNKAKDYQDSIIDIDGIVESYQSDIYSTFLSFDVKGFDSQQIKEEKLKITLLSLSDEWRDFILDTESHPYLIGQIIFLLSFSGIYDKYLTNELNWTKTEESNYFNSINIYFEKFKKLFTGSGLKEFKNELFRRALLVKGDYLLYATNYSLVIDSGRDVSWKRLLEETGNRTSDWFMKRCKYLQQLFDDINIDDIEGSLEQIIKTNECIDWRKDFIESPILIKTSSRGYLKFYDNENIYILRKSKYNKYEDPELKSVLLKTQLLKKGFEEKDIELGYVEALNQYGVVRIKNYKPKVIYNYNGNKQFMIRQKGKDDFFSKSLNTTINYIIENF